MKMELMAPWDSDRREPAGNQETYLMKNVIKLPFLDIRVVG